MGSIINGTPKRNILARNDAIWRIKRQNRCNGLCASLSEEPTNENKKLSKDNLSYMGVKNLEWIVMKFCIMLCLPHVVIHAKLCDNSFSHFCIVSGRISGFPIDFGCHPYNTPARCRSVCTKIVTKLNSMFHSVFNDELQFVNLY